MTQLEQARAGDITPEMMTVAQAEGLAPEALRELIASGRGVITRNVNRPHQRPLAVGAGLRVKVNANIGTSPDRCDPDYELRKVRESVQAGADAVMDLSTGGDITEMRLKVLEEADISVGTVPIYQAVADLVCDGQRLIDLNGDRLLQVVEQQAREGVDFMTLHCGVTRAAVASLDAEGRELGIVSRGGSLLAHWMRATGEENPLYQRYDDLLAVAREHDVTLSLGDGLRPGCLADATDRGQVHELLVLGELTQRAWDAGVQVMIEGPGHVPLDQVEANVVFMKRLCRGAPFYVLGPLVTDVAPGYDHIAGAIGGAIAARAGADFLCYVTPSEHLRLPDLRDVRDGIMASRIAAHAADLARRSPPAWERDLAMARARKAMDWEAQIELALDPRRAGEIRGSSTPDDADVCTMCGKFCAIKGLLDD